ncbi:PREDICTED: uncharacterized protein LOC106748421 [Dinoponera quadriceps]|uniref:Uncharacterized protein LOC106748421 n=1 Tax=Dinoponera quadriceps TaxID=609295 RepID=A0A6P3XV22_DINQU|nr:PREDICTED: uncharacterized protein LOC106748421 [Dinoponera quadriceps]
MDLTNLPWDGRGCVNAVVDMDERRKALLPFAGRRIAEVRARARKETTLLHPAGPSPKWVRNALWLVLKRDNSHLSIVPGTIEGTSRIGHNLDGTISLGRGGVMCPSIAAEK